MKDKDQRKGIIYCAYNKINGKRYIGQTIQGLEKRQKAHYKTSGAPRFHKALMKYKEEDWEWKIIDCAYGREELNNKEIFWIHFFNTTDNNKGYNLRPGGQDGFQTKEEIKYSRARFMEIAGKDRSNVSRAIRRSIKCVETGEIFKTAFSAGKHYNITYSHITEVLNGLKKKAGGYHWEYSNDLSCYEDAFMCVELGIVYINFTQALKEDGFNSNNLKARLTNNSPCSYGGYTFYWLNPQFH